jgi:hypothetical protein
MVVRLFGARIGWFGFWDFAWKETSGEEISGSEADCNSLGKKVVGLCLIGVLTGEGDAGEEIV